MINGEWCIQKLPFRSTCDQFLRKKRSNEFIATARVPEETTELAVQTPVAMSNLALEWLGVTYHLVTAWPKRHLWEAFRYSQFGCRHWIWLPECISRAGAATLLHCCFWADSADAASGRRLLPLGPVVDQWCAETSKRLGLGSDPQSIRRH